MDEVSEDVGFVKREGTSRNVRRSGEQCGFGQIIRREVRKIKKGSGTNKVSATVIKTWRLSSKKKSGETWGGKAKS